MLLSFLLLLLLLLLLLPRRCRSSRLGCRQLLLHTLLLLVQAQNLVDDSWVVGGKRVA